MGCCTGSAQNGTKTARRFGAGETMMEAAAMAAYRSRWLFVGEALARSTSIERASDLVANYYFGRTASAVP